MQRKEILLGLAICLVLGAFLPGPLLVADDGPREAGAVVVIGGDHKPARVRRAAELYRQGLAPVVVISAGTRVLEGDRYLPEAEVMRRQALALGLPEAVLLIEDGSQSTFQNAYYTRAICEAHGIDSILLVTSAYQSRRARRIFREVYGPGISVAVQPSPADLCSLCWWFDADQVPVVLHECYNWARYWLGIRLPAEAAPQSRLIRRDLPATAPCCPAPQPRWG